MQPVTRIQQIDILILCILLLIAGWMRLGRGEVVEYFHDDAMLATLALEMADGETFPVTGILSSTGIPNPPISVYLMAIPFSISANPNIAIYFVMLLNVVGVGLLWLIAHRYFGRQVGIIAGLLYAINPWAVLFSRKIWAQDFHTPFVLLGIVLLLYGFWETKDRLHWKHRLAQTLSIPVLLFAFQIHFASWAIAPIILIVLWVGRKNISGLALIVSTLFCIAVLVPYTVGLTQTLEEDPNRVTDAAGRSRATDGLSLSTEPLLDSLYLSSGIGLETWVAPDQQSDLSQTYPPFVLVSYALAAFMIIGLIVSWNTQQEFALLLFVWGLLAQLILVPSWTPVYIHYFIPAIPAMILLSAIGIHFVLQWIAKYRGLVLVVRGMVFVIVGLQVVTWHKTLDYVAIQHIPYPGFTTPISNLNTIREELKDVQDVVVISQGMSWNLHHEVAVWETLLWDDVACVRTMMGDGYAVFPAHPFRVLITPDAPKNPVHNLYRTDNPITFETRQGDNGYTLYKWETTPDWNQIPIQAISPTQFDNQVQLTGYAFENDIVYLEWRLPAQHKGANYQYSAQLFDQAGNRIAQLDKTFWHGRHWCEYDRLITWGILPSNTLDAVTLKVGMYILGTGKHAGQFFNANILDELGNPRGQSADIQLN